MVAELHSPVLKSRSENRVWGFKSEGLGSGQGSGTQTGMQATYQPCGPRRNWEETPAFERWAGTTAGAGHPCHGGHKLGTTQPFRPSSGDTASWPGLEHAGSGPGLREAVQTKCWVQAGEGGRGLAPDSSPNPKMGCSTAPGGALHPGSCCLRHSGFGLVWKGGIALLSPEGWHGGRRPMCKCFHPVPGRDCGEYRVLAGARDFRCVCDTAPPVSNASTLTPRIPPLALVGTVGGPAL